jgi:trimethylamine--corrinoid protein Co-methyltransferase
MESKNMSTQYMPLEPLKTSYHLNFLSEDQLDDLQKATLAIIERTGVRFPSQKALNIFAEHGAQVDWQSQVVRMHPDFVLEKLSTIPRFFRMGARNPFYDLQLAEDITYFTTDGCGVETIDFDTHQRRPSCKADVGLMALISDYLPSIGFIWPMVSAQDHGKTAPLHEIDAAWNNSVKHVQSETVMGEIPCRYAAEMATVIAGSREEARLRPPFSLVVCTIAPLVQDTAGIEGALILAEAGLPVGFLAMPTLGTTAPATLAGAFAMGDAEIISAAVLMQLHAPGAPVFHSLMQAWADPRTGGYISYSLDSRTRYAPVEMAHHWGMASLGACYGTDAHEPGTWQGAGEVALDPYLAGLAGADIVTGLGLSETYTLLYPEQIILDDDLYQRARYQLMNLDVNEETLALDTIHSVGPGGHYLGQKHTRLHFRDSLVRGVTHQLGEDGKYRDPRQVAIEKVDWIRKNHQPEPLEIEKQTELKRILAAADKELCEG